jgi:formylglycine-generating enzyme required for sulfatase activity
MSAVTALSVCIDKYEASQGSAGEAVSAAGAVPWVSLTTAEAEAACQAVGKHLCTEGEWQAACAGPSGYAFPYGNTYSGSACNGLDSGKGAIVDTGSMAGCEGGYPGLYDMSGNAYERTASCTGGQCRIKGGSYRSSASALLLRCDRGFDFPESGPDPAVGFRCCR